MKLYIGNKNYSSWSLRAWLVLRVAEIEFTEVKLRLDSGADSAFRRALKGVSPSGKVPVLVDGDLAVWDTLAIAEYVAETHPEKAPLATDRSARARARSICAEMHSGFAGLRQHCPMNIEASLPEVGPKLIATVPSVASDLVANRCDVGGCAATARRPVFVRRLHDCRCVLRSSVFAHHNLRSADSTPTRRLCDSRAHTARNDGVGERGA